MIDWSLLNAIFPDFDVRAGMDGENMGHYLFYKNKNQKDNDVTLKWKSTGDGDRDIKDFINYIISQKDNI